MDINEEVKEADRLAEWRKRNDAELADINEKSAINFYGVAGLIIAVFSGIFGLFTDYYMLALAIPLGFIVMGIGEGLRYLRKIANK